MARILIIEDEKAIRNVLRNILINEDKSHQVFEAEDGEMGLTQLTENTFDLVLCDIKMPKKDGMEVLEFIMKSYGDTPVEVRSGESNAPTHENETRDEFFDCSLTTSASLLSSPPASARTSPHTRGKCAREDKELEYRRRLASLGENHLKTLQAKMSFARSIDDPTMSDLAVKTAEEAERGIASLLGEQHPRALSARAALAGVLDMHRGDSVVHTRRAAHLYKNVIEGHTNGLGDAVGSECMACKASLGAVLAKLGETAQAAKLFNHVATVFADRYGRDDNRTLSVAFNEVKMHEFL